MVLDIVLAAIVLASMIFGFRRGFVYTFTHTLGWLGALIAGFFLAPFVRDYMQGNTGMYDSILQAVRQRFEQSTNSVDNAVDSFPALISRGIQTAAEDASNALAVNLADLIMIILCFAMVLVTVKVIFFLLTRFLSKKENRGFIGFFDGFLGFIAGTLKGIIIVMVILALLLPTVNLIAPDQTDTVLTALDNSRISRMLYDSNFIVLLIHDFFS